MRNICCPLFLLLLIHAAVAQTKTGKPGADNKRLNDLAADGYYGRLRQATKITWKDAPDSLLNNSGGFDSLYKIAEELITGHFTFLSTYYRQRAKDGYIDAAIMNETFDSSGNAREQADLMAANAMNVTYKYEKYNGNKSIIDIYNNHTGAKTGAGYVRWVANNKREQHLAMNNGFVIDAILGIAGNMPGKEASMLKYKSAFIINAKTSLLSKANRREIWLHTEHTKTLYQKKPETVITDTITHNILARDAEGNIVKEIITHSRKENKVETVFHRYEYYP